MSSPGDTLHRGRVPTDTPGTHLVSSLPDSTGRGLLQLLRVLEKEGVAQARAKEQVPRLHGDHLREGAGWGGSEGGWTWTQTQTQTQACPQRPLTLLVSTLAAALSKWKARTLRIPSVMRVST